MNPDTKLTDEQIKEICARHNIPYISHKRINSGFSHEVHRLNDDLVIKLFNTTEPRNYNTELALLKSSLDFAKPKLIASHKATNKQDRSYIIMSFVQGFSLGSKWHLATEAQREQLIHDISKTLITINSIDPKTISNSTNSWQNTIENRIDKLVNKLLAKNIITKQQAQNVNTTTKANLKYLANAKLYPVYWDIHFDNFIVDENFELQAIIDLENVELAALDYSLFVVDGLMAEPYKYLREEDEKHAKIEDYCNLRNWYKKYYPQMFEFKNLNNRVKLYTILTTLSLLVDWAEDSKLYEKLDKLTQKSN